MKQQRKILILIDGNALIHRSYHGLPPLTTKTGELVNAVYGFATTLLSVIEKFHPEYVAASFDLSGPTFRHEKFAEYKGTRTKAPDDLYVQIPRVKELVRAFNIPVYELQGFEADDVIGTLSRQATETTEDVDTIIVTGDSDSFQLINDRVRVFTMRKGVKDTVLYDRDAVITRYGLTPEQLKDYKGLRGDTSDNIPGVKGIGEKGATDLLQRFGNLESVYASLEEMKGAVRQKLETNKEIAFLSKELGTIDVNAPVKLDLVSCVMREFDREKVADLFRDLNFLSLLKRLPSSTDSDASADNETAGENSLKTTTKTKKERIIETKQELEDFFGAIENGLSASFLLEMQAGTLFGSSLRSVSIVSEKNRASIPFSSVSKPFLKRFFEDEHLLKTTYGVKESLKILQNESIGLASADFDIMIAGYLLDAGGKVSLEELVFSELGEEIAAHSVFRKAETMVKLRDSFERKLTEISSEQKANGLTSTLKEVFSKVEMPLIDILAAMELRGVRLNGSVLQKLSQELSETVKTLEKEVYDFAGKTFNINSPKQLAVVLFEDLHIPTAGIKKLKTGFSTASPELVKLRDNYLIVQKIESYRELFKLKTTYLDVLPRLVDAHSRIHTLYHQEVTSTGRLSSSNPNLQNIPARNRWGERIRGAFEAENGFVLVGADYSQIELRVAAHLANDETMIEAFRKNEDIHRTTASLVHGIAPEEVTDEQRRQAKVLNFGIMYGMGSFGLAAAAGINREEASDFIKGYFKKFSGMATYLEGMKVFARENGYVETEIGRRRYIPEMNSRNQQVVRGAERMAVNMPIQGLEADIVKLAMIATDAMIKNRFFDSARMLLQVHDELIFEVKEKRAEEFSQAVKETMESVYKLKVPLTVGVCVGKNWGEI